MAMIAVSGQALQATTAHSIVSTPARDVAHTLTAATRISNHASGIKTTKTVAPAQRSIARADEEEAYTVTVSYPNLGDREIIGLAYASDTATNWELCGDNEEFTVAGGHVYSVAAIFKESEPGQPSRVVVNENVRVDSDMSITLDPSTATELVQFKPVNVDGEEIIGPMLDSSYDVVAEGNINSEGSYICSSFASRRYGLLFYYESNFNRIESDDNTINQALEANMLVNPGLSSDFACTYLSHALTPDGKTAMLIKLESDGTRAQSLSNSSDEFAMTSYDEIFTSANYPKGMGEIEKEYTWYGWIDSWLGIPNIIMTCQGDLYDSLNHLAYSVPGAPNDEKPFYDIFPYVNPMYDGITEEVEGGSVTPNYCSYPPLMRQLGTKMHAIVTPMFGSYFENAFLIGADGIDIPLTLWGEPDFSHELGSSPQVAGDNACMLQYIDLTTDYRIGCQWLSLGRVGESPLNLPTNVYVSFDGREVSGDWDKVINDYRALWGDINASMETYKGLIVNRIESVGGIVIDGIDAYGMAEATYDRSQNVDINVPQLTMLQFRGKDDTVTDHFEKASDGTVRFTAADFVHLYDPVYDADGNMTGVREWYKFTSTPEVTVEYAPLHSDDWQKLDVEEDEAKFCPVGYGSFFSGSLDKVDQKAPKGWFDIRISLRDAGGNSLVSVVSPAFHIEELAGIDSNVIPESNATVTAIYNLQGMKVSNPEGICIEVMSDGTSRKVIR